MTAAIQTQWLCAGHWCACADSVTECDCLAAALADPTACARCKSPLMLIDFATGVEVAGEARAVAT
jgi:hypothetical protein